ncbi:MAG: DarT ssDNA thymidine ADP-ribosyltransferase family protein [Clostridia bacterium]
MDYVNIIRENCEKHSPVSWWPKFAFHYTDVTNAASILSSGYLYSRADASTLRVMRNDNASRHVIDITNSGVISKVRFYFRPLTPTQYYNEGYKHPALRYDCDENANVPVPIFLLFDLNKLLSLPGVEFSEISQAGHGAIAYRGVEAFSNLNFDYIYDNSYQNLSTTKAYRHAEITHPNSMPIESCIKTVLCRNSLERTTLINLLREENPTAFARYQKIIKVHNDDTFENNGFFISDCSYHNNTVSIAFSDTYASKKYVERMMKKNDLGDLKPIRVTVWLKWFNSRTVYNRESIETTVDIRNSRGITIKGLPTIRQAKDIGIEVYFDDKLMCSIKQPIEMSELWK